MHSSAVTCMCKRSNPNACYKYCNTATRWSSIATKMANRVKSAAILVQYKLVCNTWKSLHMHGSSFCACYACANSYFNLTLKFMPSIFLGLANYPLPKSVTEQSSTLSTIIHVMSKSSRMVYILLFKYRYTGHLP